MEIKGEIYNLEINRPQVLLVGNGITRAYNDDFKWEKLIGNLKKDNNVSFDTIGLPPNTIYATIMTAIDDKDRTNSLLKEFENYKYNHNPLIDKLLDISFDAILTTNYTYDFEEQLHPGFSHYSNNSKNKNFTQFIQKDSKYLLHTFNNIKKGEKNFNIWHIHGELRRPSSLILTHDNYARLIGKILEHNKLNRDNYSRYYNELHIHSWIDYLLIGDVYIIGSGFDFAEFDLWWFLSRRLREKAPTGTITYFAANEKDKRKLSALKLLDVKNKEYNDNNYIRCYEQAIEDMSKLILKQRRFT